ncbi:MAG: 16S rRNA (uracil(1498)-N(3))-methyltransferase [Kiritimatiellales bacterium]|nr:16S rRNA (uracil(1498)-N(3))-methyltransferase [Kiritimatiellales bacterium]
MNLIIIHPDEMDAENRVVLADGRAWHIRKVLKAELGKQLRVGLLMGPLGTGIVESIDKNSVLLKCVFETEPPPQPAVDLLLAMPRPKVMKRLWAQLAALGVGRIVLVNAEKVEKYYFDSHVLEPEFFNARLVEGLQQARCTHLPEVLVRRRFKPFVEDELDLFFRDSLKLLADPNGRKKPADFFQGLDKPERVLLAVGPEGGWTSYELDKLLSHGFELFGMGPRILRTDTACVGLLSVLAEYLRM